MHLEGVSLQRMVGLRSLAEGANRYRGLMSLEGPIKEAIALKFNESCDPGRYSNKDSQHADSASIYNDYIIQFFSMVK